jgi:hypothetical protein
LSSKNNISLYYFFMVWYGMVSLSPDYGILAYIHHTSSLGIGNAREKELKDVAVRDMVLVTPENRTRQLSSND